MTPAISPDEVAALVAACVRHSDADGRPRVVVVVDAQGDLLHLRRPPQVHAVFGPLAVAMASTAATFGMPRDVVAGWQSRRPVLHMHLSRLGRQPVVPSEGAAAVSRGGVVVGGLAVYDPLAVQGHEDTCQRALAQLGYDVAGAQG